MQFSKNTFGYTKEKELVSIYRLENTSGAYLEVSDYGCRVMSLCVPDRNGVLTDVCLGYSDMEGYETDSASMGAAVGRHANRIGGSSFTLDGITYELEKNDGPNHLHGGSKGFAFRIWEAEHSDNRIIFSRLFPDGEDGYPGNLQMKIIYEWTNDNRLLITYEALSDKNTVVNVTNHTYFNLEGSGSSSVLEHELQIFASAITANDSNCLPTGEILPVGGTPFDFNEAKPIGRDICADNEQLRSFGGYDHNYILDQTGFRRVATLQAPATGIRMFCDTDQPGLQLYSANSIGNSIGKFEVPFCKHNSVCLETQHFPNATSIPAFPSVVINAKTPFITTTWYSFDVF